MSGARPRVPFDDPSLFESLDEDAWDLRQKKLFLFRPERIDLSLNRLEHYTGTSPERFQRHVLFTNYEMHAEAFRARYPGAVGPGRSVQMPAWHHELPGAAGLTLVNIGVGPSNAKTITDHLAVLRPDAILMVGHCAGLRNHQEIGDLVLATGHMRDDRILDDVLPTSVPISVEPLPERSPHRGDGGARSLLPDGDRLHHLEPELGVQPGGRPRRHPREPECRCRHGVGHSSPRTASATGSRRPPSSASATSRSTASRSCRPRRRPSTARAA